MNLKLEFIVLFSMIFCLFIHCEKDESITIPLKNQTYEYVELPNNLFDSLTLEEKANYEELYNHMIFVKPEEYKVILAELNDLMMNYQEEYNALLKLSNNVVNSQETLKTLTSEDKVQSILGGQGITELNFLKNNLQYGIELLKNELNNIYLMIKDYYSSMETNFEDPIRDLIKRISSINNDIEKYLYSFQLINVFRERYHAINQINLVISENMISINYLINTWNHIMNEMDILFKEQLGPIIDDNKKKNNLISSGDDIRKRLELMNSMIMNEILLKYNKLDNQLQSNYKTHYSVSNEAIVELKNSNNNLIKEFNIIPFNIESINISDLLIQWQIEILPSIQNIFEKPVFKSLIDIKDIENIQLIDINDIINQKISDINNKLNELIQIKSETNSIWLTLKYLSKDDILININEKLKSITENNDLNIENEERNNFLYEKLINERNYIQDLVSSVNLTEINQIYLSIKTIKCLNKLYQVYDKNNLYNLMIYSKTNLECTKFFVNEINSFRTNIKTDGLVSKSEYIIEYYITLFFLDKEYNSENDLDSFIVSFIDKLNQENQDQNSDKKQRIDLIIKNVNIYNENSTSIINQLENSKKIISDIRFELIKQYLEDLKNVLNEHINESINSKEDAIIIFEHLNKVLMIFSEELNEKELNNQQLMISLNIRLEEIKSLFNDFIARINLEFDRKDRINNQEFINKNKEIIEKLNDEVQVLKNEFNQLNNYLFQKHAKNILLLLIFVYSSKLLLNPRLIDNSIILNSKSKTIELNNDDLISKSFREKYKYVLIQLGYYNKLYNEFKDKKNHLLEKENKFNNQINEIEIELSNRSKVTSIHPSVMQRIRKQKKIAEKIFNGYITLYISIYNSKSEIIKNTIFALDNAISNYKAQIKDFKKQNHIGSKIGFKRMAKNFFNLKKYHRNKKYYKRMKKFDDYLNQKREQIVEYLKYTENNMTILNKDIIKFIDYYLCKNNNFLKNDLENANINNLIDNIEPIQIIIGDIYNIFSKLGRIEYLYSPKYLMSISKMLSQVLKQYRNINQNINRIQKKLLKLHLSQQKTIESTVNLIKIILPASYIIKRYNRLPKQYLKYNTKIGLDDINDHFKHLNIRGWDLKKGKKSLSLENQLIIERKYINSEEEFHEMQREINKQIKDLSLMPDDININRYDGKTVIFLIPDELLQQILFELERNQLALKQGIVFDKNNSKNDIKTVINDFIQDILKKRKELFIKLASKSFLVEQGECSANKG